MHGTSMALLVAKNWAIVAIDREGWGVRLFYRDKLTFH